MGVQKKVKTIPATLTRFTASPITEQKKRKVAGYARVSTDHDDQFSSYEAQIDYYGPSCDATTKNRLMYFIIKAIGHKNT